MSVPKLDRQPGLPPTRIALLCTNFKGGGVQMSMVRTANRLVALGHQTDLLVFERDGPLGELCDPSVRVVELPPTSMTSGRLLAIAADPGGLSVYLRPVLLARPGPHRLPHLASLLRYVRARRPGGMISASSVPNLIAVLARRLARVPMRLVVSQRDILHSPEDVSRHWRRRHLAPALRRAYGMADGIVAVSEGLADAIAAEIAIARAAVTVIYNPVVSAELRERAAMPLDHPWFAAGQPPVVLAVGRLSAQKDHPTLLDAFARLRARRSARLVILGDARTPEETRSEIHKLRDLASALGVADDVDVAGFAANPAAYMARASVLAFSSRHEGLGNVLIEALACGCPIVSTDCPHGPSEILAHGKFGRLVPVGDAAAMAAALEATLAAPPSRELLRARGAEFTIERAVDAYLDLLTAQSALA